MRLFLALELPEGLKQRLAEVQAELRGLASGERVSWTRDEAMHLTCKFLGDAVDPGPILDAVRDLEPPGSLQLEVTGVGSFGGRRPRVVWAGVGGPDRERLVDLAGALDRAVASLGIEPESRAFAPHVTLGRVRSRGAKRSRLSSALKAVSFEPWPFEATELVLFSSTHGTGKGPARYAAEGRWQFQTK